MDKNKLQELLEARALADQQLERMRASVTILFSDIQGSTTYYEKKGDVQGLAMVERHHSLMLPVIEDAGGRVVKTIGDAIMASFADPVGAVKAAIGMQRALAGDRSGKTEEEQVHIRVGLHTGLGLVQDDDVFGDVVNAASRVQHQAKPDQILVTDVLIDAVRQAGAQCVRLGRADLKGKDEPLDVYAVAWSTLAAEQLMDELRNQFEGKLKEMRRQYDRSEQEFESARSSWRIERRALHEEIEKLEMAVDKASENVRNEVTSDLRAELTFQLEDAVRSKRQLEDEFGAMQLKWNEERTALRAQIAAVEGAMVDALERSNNPARVALAVREQLDARIDQARRNWQIESEGERRRLNIEIERLRKINDNEAKKDAARAAVLQKLGRAQPGQPGPAARTAEDSERDFEAAKIQWETERAQLKLNIDLLERQVKAGKDEVRAAIYQELRNQYEPQLAQATRERQRAEQEMGGRVGELDLERQRLSDRVAALQQAVIEAQEASRRQTAADLKLEYDVKLEELRRLKSRADRRLQDQVDESESERRRLQRQIAQLETQLKEARETAFRAQRVSAEATQSSS
jgi:class 3 adenylate cyclase